MRVLGRAEAESIYEVRAALEALAGQLFAQRATEQQRQALRERLDAAEKVITQAPVTEQLAAKDIFYQALFAGAHSPAIETTLQPIHNRIQLLRGMSLQTQGRPDRVITELRAIVEHTAIHPNPDAAWKACRHHVEAAAATALRQLDDTNRTTAVAPHGIVHD